MRERLDREAYARSVGFASWAEREEAIRRQQEIWRKADQWRQELRLRPAKADPE